MGTGSVEMTFVFILAVCFVVGISVAIKTALWVQLLLIVCGVLYLNSDYVRRMEIAGLIPLAMFYVATFGMIIGDAYFFYAYQQTMNPVDVIEILKWPFKP